MRGTQSMMKWCNCLVLRDFEPQKGQEFDSKEAAYSFNQEYARSVGFGITIKASRRSKKSDKFIDVKIACSRFETKRSPRTTATANNSTAKTNCKAGMHMKRSPDGKWYIYSIAKEHNHDICPDDFYIALQGGKHKQQLSSSIIDQCRKKGLHLALTTRRM